MSVYPVFTGFSGIFCFGRYFANLGIFKYDFAIKSSKSVVNLPFATKQSTFSFPLLQNQMKRVHNSLTSC